MCFYLCLLCLNSFKKCMIFLKTRRGGVIRARLFSALFVSTQFLRCGDLMEISTTSEWSKTLIQINLILFIAI